MEHIGAIIKDSKYGFKLSRETYIHPSNKSSFGDGLIYDEKFIKKHIKDSLINFDLNMEFFKQLNQDEYIDNLNNFLNKNPQFKIVYNLNDFKEKSGYYVMVLEEYKQVYLGTTTNLFERIKKHWIKQLPFDRLIFGTIKSSKLSIDVFRPLDTTRIYFYETKQIYSLENKYINEFKDKFVLNRTEGGFHAEGLKESIKLGLYRKL
ncbi:MAG: hypothetical protein J6Q13_03605 [Clostridia bacterium]|nr:hypothetical protein [Clostridia bacterium]